jgi:DNA mismatch repair protein MSH5
MEWGAGMCAERNVHFLIPDNGLASEENILAGEVGFTSQKGKLLTLAGFVDLENKVSLGCAGAILQFLQKHTTWGVQSPSRVRHVEVFTLRGVM